jgi:hypothetical protein
MEEKKKDGSSIGGLIFVGCMFIGGGIGMFYNSTQIGGAIGMGAGFIAMGAIRAYYRNQ